MAKSLQPVSINGIEFDALIQSDESYTSTVPEYVVESGFTVSDAIILESETLSFTLIVSNMPVTWANRSGHSGDRVARVTQQLKNLYFSKSLVTVTTSTASYSNMAITKLAFPKSNKMMEAIEVSIELKKVRVTETQTTSIPQGYGKSGTSDASAGTASTSSESADANSAASSQEAESQNASSILYEAAKRIGLMN